MISSILNTVSLLFIVIGMFMTMMMMIMESKKGLYVGWLLLAIGMFINAYSLAFFDGRLALSLLNIGAGMLDLYLFCLWRKRYNESKLSRREKFLKEIMNSKK